MILPGKIAMGMASLGLAAAGVLCSEGVVHVKVIENEPKSFHLNLIAPAMLAPIAVRLAPRPGVAQAAQRVQPYMPVIRAALDGLRETDDVVLVEVKAPGQHVKVSKLAGSIIVDVDDAGETVHVSAPIRAISRTVEELAGSISSPLDGEGN